MARQMQELSLATIRRIDLGKVAMAFDIELARAVADIHDRPGLDRARSVVLQVDMEPGDEEGIVHVGFQVKGRVPQKQTRPYSMVMVGENALRFNAESPEDPRQMTMTDGGDKGDAES